MSINKDINKIVGENLKIARKAKGLTQKEVAKTLNKFQSDYSEYENGKIELDYYKIVFLCKLFDITPNELFGFN
ncbi:MAG TPA: transcriptional regulator [Clostridiales bacterium]|nr:transcriptional regulator [Clostridiales bacterium]